MKSINYIASAGTGKTYRLVNDVLEKLREGISLREMMILTFTEKAAQEIKHRLYEEIKKEKKHWRELLNIELSYIGTFHSVFLRVLRKYPDETEINGETEVLSENSLQQFLFKEFETWIENEFQKNSKVWETVSDISVKELFDLFYHLYQIRHRAVFNSDIKLSRQLLERKEKQILKLLEKYKKPSYQILKDAITKRDYHNIDIKKFKNLDKNLLLQIEDLVNLYLDLRATAVLQMFSSFSTHIDLAKKEKNAVDFDDILHKTDRLLDRKNINFRCVFVDEFQDTDTVQISILKKLSKDEIYVYGDPKQCIYSWRNADLESYFDFVKDMDSRILSRNYRSFREIVDFCNSLLSSSRFLSHIKPEYRKPSTCDSVQKGEVKIFNLKNAKKPEEEAEFTAQLIRDLVQEGYRYRDITVLLRTNSLINRFVSVLQRLNIPVKDSGSSDITKTEEIKTLLNVLRFIEDSENPANILKLLRSPFVMADEKQILRSGTALKSYKNKNLEKILKIKENKFHTSPEELLNALLDETDIMQFFSCFPDGKSKIKNIHAFRTIVSKLSYENYSLRDILFYFENTPEKGGSIDDENAVEVMTIHKAKGLQNKVVIIPRISQDPMRLTPKRINILADKLILNYKTFRSYDYSEYEEYLKNEIRNEMERLFYVAVTRAQERLYLISSEGKNYRNSFKNMIPEDVYNRYSTDLDFSKLHIKPVKFHTPETFISPRKSKEIEIFLLEKFRESLDNQRFTTVSRLMNEKSKTNKTGENQEKAAYIGTVIHSIFEKVDFKSFDPQKVVQNLYRYTGIVPENILKDVEMKVIQIINSFASSQILRELKNSEILLREVPFVINHNGRFVEGRIDVIYKKGDDLCILDYKTGKQKSVKDIIRAYEIQKIYYKMAVERVFSDQNIRFKIGFLTTGELIEID